MFLNPFDNELVGSNYDILADLGFYKRGFGSEIKKYENPFIQINADNIDSGTDGGNDTEDKIFFLSESEVSRNSAADYGFVPSVTIKDEGRFCKSSTYAKARGGLWL